MPSLKESELQDVQNNLSELAQKTNEYHEGKINIKDYKGFSGHYGTFSQRGGKSNMLRLRMNAGELDKKKMKFIVDFINTHKTGPIHSATCQTVQIHDLDPEEVVAGIKEALEAGIITYGTGGDYPRNIMCSPLAGVDPNEVFDVSPYAKKAAEYLVETIEDPLMPRKMKTAFSGGDFCNTHATYRDLGFVARANGTFDVFAAGGLGPNPRFGVKVAENVAPEDVLYYIRAMINTFKKYGDNKDKRKARTRYMVEALGGEDAFRNAYLAELEKVLPDPSLKITEVEEKNITKTGNGSKAPDDWRVIAQKQDGLYAVRYHAPGGCPDHQVFTKLYETIEPMDQVELRTSPEQTFFIINLNGKEAKAVIDVIDEDSARNPFESSVSCIGAARCQVGLRDSQELLRTLIREVRAAQIKDGALPQIHVSGCPSSCGAHQTGRIGIRGTVKVINRKVVPAFTLFIDGCDTQDASQMGTEIGSMPEEVIDDFIVDLGKTVSASGMSYDEWHQKDPDALKEIAQKYMFEEEQAEKAEMAAPVKK